MARRLLTVSLLAAAALAVAPSASAACTRWASSHGNDRHAGTGAAPFRTIGKLLAALPNGGTGCLARGSVFRERVFVSRPVTLRSAGGRATLLGSITIRPSVPNVAIRGLAIRGSGVRGRAAVHVQGDRARIVGNDVSGPGYHDRDTPCILLDGARDALIDGNRIHNCTRSTGSGAYAPGVFVASALRTRISNNVVFHTLGDAIALAPNSQRSRVVHNLVDGNESGVYIGGNERTASSNNVVLANIISNSGRWNVHSAWTGPVGRGNVVASNCLWHGFGGNLVGGGFAREGNIVAAPRFAARPRDFTLLGGRCLSKRPRIVAARIAALGPVRVHYRLRALPQRVQVGALSLSGLSAGTRVAVRCRSGCGARWSGTAKGPLLALPVLRGAWLPRGAVVEIRARRTGFAGAYVRVSVTGLPRGVSVTHACLPPGGDTIVSCSGFRGA